MILPLFLALATHRLTRRARDRAATGLFNAPKHGGITVAMLAVPSRVAQGLPHLTGHDVSEIDAEVRAVIGVCLK